MHITSDSRSSYIVSIAYFISFLSLIGNVFLALQRSATDVTNSGRPCSRLLLLALLIPNAAHALDPDLVFWFGPFSNRDAARTACETYVNGSCLFTYNAGRSAPPNTDVLYFKDYSCELTDIWWCSYRFETYKDQCPSGLSSPDSGLCLDQIVRDANAGNPSCPMGEGNPVHVGTGNKYQREMDIAPTIGNGLEFIRHYNSQIDGSMAALGKWSHTYNRRLILTPNYRVGVDSVDPELTESTIQLVRPDGRKIIFYQENEFELAATRDDIPEWIPAVGTDQYPLHWTGAEWRYRNDSNGLEYYNEAGQLLRIVSREGLTQYVEHDTQGRITEVRDDFDRTLNFEYDADGRLSRLEDPVGKAWLYAYDADGNLITVTDPDGAVRIYHYAEFGAPTDYLTGITDENGNRYATWKYDNQGRAILSEHADGVDRTELEYLSDGRVRVTDASGGERTYSIETVRGRMLADSIENGCASCGNTTDWEYNDLGLPTREIDRNGNVTTYQYDAHGLEVSRTEAAGTLQARTITTEWNAELRLPLVVTEPGLRTEYTYDARGRRLSMTETDMPTGRERTTTWRYHPDSGGVPGQLAEVDGPRTDVDDITYYEYDTQGNRARVINALGHVTEITDHDAYGRPLTLVDPNGLTTNLTYDARGRLLSRDVGGEVTAFGYDGVGNLTAISLPDGSELHYEYDAAQRLVAIADEDGNRIDYTLDAAGNRVEQDVRDETGLLVRTQQQVFNELDRLIQTIGAQGQITNHTYDDNGNRLSTTDPAGNASHDAFDALDRVTQVTDPMGGVTSYNYDERDRITSVTDPDGNTTTYTWDGLGNRARVDSPDSGITTFEHDAAGNIIARVDAKGQRAEHSYDALNRLVRTDYSDGASVVYRWDEGANGIGRLAAIDETGPDGWMSTVEWSYDTHGRIVERSQTADALTLTTRHSYDSAGRRVETVYPSGRAVVYRYVDDELTGISVDGTTVLGDIEYQPFGPVSGWTWGDGDVHSREYDLDGRLTRHDLAIGSQRGGTRTIDYTADDNIATITGPNIARNYGYDGLDRLIAANDPDRTDSYSYDANGNRLSRTTGGATESYTVESGSNRLLGVSGAREASYGYDANGGLVDDGEHSYTYSARNRLTAVDGGTTAIYRYNALGQRIYKRAGSGVDYAALAAEYQALADEHRAEAESLQRQADQKRAAGDAAAAQAEQLRTEAESLRTQADQHEQEAATRADEATRWRTEAAELVAQAESKEQEALPLQQQADRLFSEAAELRTQADAEWQAAEDDQQRADQLVASAESRRAHADALDRQASENDRIAAESRARVPELGAEAEALRAEAGQKEAAAQPYLREVEKLQHRIDPVQRVVDRFDARIEALRDRRIDDPANRREERRNALIDRLIAVLEHARGRIQWRVDDWLAEQANYQAQADALLDEAASLRQKAEQNDQLAVELAADADRLEAEAVELRAEAASERTLAAQEQAESEEYVRQAQVHREAAQGLDNQVQSKEDEARPPADRAATLRTEAASLRGQAETKIARAEDHEQEADRLTQLAADKRATAGQNEQQGETLDAEAIRLHGEAEALQAEAETVMQAENSAQQQADEYAELAENPPTANEEQYFVYGEEGRLLGRYDQNGNAVREYIWLSGLPIAISNNKDILYIHSDHLGTPRAVSEPNGAVVWTWVSDAFGDTEPNEDPDGDGETFTLNLRHPGQYHDEETGRHYNYFRTYDPGIGRYVTSDPIGLEGGVNTYSYAFSNPLRWFDPFGLEVQICCRPAEIANGTVDHCWVRTDAQDVGLSGNPNVRPGEEYESLYVTQTYPTDHSDDSASSCETMNNVDEQCVDDTLQDMLGEPQGGFGPANNCQQFAYSVVNQCRTGPQILPEE